MYLICKKVFFIDNILCFEWCLYIFFKKLELIYIFIKIVMLKVFFKEKKNECISNILVYSYVLW